VGDQIETWWRHRDASVEAAFLNDMNTAGNRYEVREMIDIAHELSALS